MGRNKSKELFDIAKKVIPGGVNSPVRSFASVGGEPLFALRSAGSKIYDADNNEYVDYICSWGPMILGHAYGPVLAKVRAALDNGVSYGMSTELEVQMAQVITDAFPAMDMVRLVNSGTEATMSALRLARGYTGREKIVKFDGCYHGHHDSLLVKSGSGLATFGQSSSEGVPESLVANTISIPYNDTASLKECFSRHGDSIAAVIIEPIAGNMGLVPPAEGFLEAVRDVTRQAGALLIFDEVITGFRLEYGGAQTVYGIDPDLTCLGKIIGGGFPVGAYGGKREIMDRVSPSGGVYQAGTLSGNPIAVTAGLATLKILKNSDVYDRISSLAEELCRGIADAADAAGVIIDLKRIGSMICVFFTERSVTDFNSAASSDTARFGKYFQGMLDEGICLPPSQFETFFVSYSHSHEDIAKTIEAVRKSMKRLSG